MLRLRGDRFDLRAELQLRYGIEVFAHCGSNQRNDCSTGFYSPDRRSPRISGAEIADQTLHLTIVPSDHYPEVGLWKAFRWRAGGKSRAMVDRDSGRVLSAASPHAFLFQKSVNGLCAG
jgi:hypothetical protein